MFIVYVEKLTDNYIPDVSRRKDNFKTVIRSLAIMYVMFMTCSSSCSISNELLLLLHIFHGVFCAYVSVEIFRIVITDQQEKLCNSTRLTNK
jgi:hypothetical protein